MSDKSNLDVVLLTVSLLTLPEEVRKQIKDLEESGMKIIRCQTYTSVEVIDIAVELAKVVDGEEELIKIQYAKKILEEK